MDPRRRPRYASVERLRILWHRFRHGHSVRATARIFGVSVQTVLNWRRDASRGEPRLVRGRRAGCAIGQSGTIAHHPAKRLRLHTAAEPTLSHQQPPSDA